MMAPPYARASPRANGAAAGVSATEELEGAGSRVTRRENGAEREVKTPRLASHIRWRDLPGLVWPYILLQSAHHEEGKIPSHRGFRLFVYCRHDTRMRFGVPRRDILRCAVDFQSNRCEAPDCASAARQIMVAGIGKNARGANRRSLGSVDGSRKFRDPAPAQGPFRPKVVGSIPRPIHNPKNAEARLRAVASRPRLLCVADVRRSRHHLG